MTDTADRAFRGLAQRSNRIRPAAGTNRKDVSSTVVGWSVATENIQEIARRRNVVGRLVPIKRPLLLGAIDPPEIVGACVHRDDRTRFDEIRNSDNKKQEYYRDSNEDVLCGSRHNDPSSLARRSARTKTAAIC